MGPLQLFFCKINTNDFDLSALDGNDFRAMRRDQNRAAVHFRRVAYRDEDLFNLTGIVDDQIVDLADVVAAERQHMAAHDAVR